MNLQPLDDRILVQRLASEEKTAGGILLPDSAKDKPQKGKVTAVGPGKMNKDGKRAAMQVKSATRSCSPPGPATNSRSNTRPATIS